MWSGSVEKKQADKVYQRWQRAAGIRKRPAKITRAILRKMGIGLKTD